MPKCDHRYDSVRFECMYEWRDVSLLHIFAGERAFGPLLRNLRWYHRNEVEVEQLPLIVVSKLSYMVVVSETYRLRRLLELSCSEEDALGATACVILREALGA